MEETPTDGQKPDQSAKEGTGTSRIWRGFDWFRRHKVVTAILFLLSVLAPVTTVIRNYDAVLEEVGLREDTEAQVTAADAVRECIRAHRLTKAQDRVWRTEPKLPGEASDQTRVFRTCDWPPGPGADPDGYREISVRFAIGPNTESQWPIGPAAYRLRSDNCDTFKVLVSRGGGTGHLEPQPPVTVRRNEIRTVENEVWRDDPGFTKLPFQRERNEALVLYNEHFVLDGVDCSKGVSTD